MKDNITKREAISIAVDEGNSAYKTGYLKGQSEAFKTIFKELSNIEYTDDYGNWLIETRGKDFQSLKTKYLGGK